MPKIMLINVTHSEESRVAILNQGVLESFEIESLSREHLKGNIYKGIVHRIHPALEAAFVDIGAERDAFLPLDEICFRNLAQPPARSSGENGRRRRIRDVLRPGEEVLVQITKEQFANKPPTLTTFYSLPGRYLVLLPGSDETGISRRIEGEDRTRLRKMVADLEPPDGFGVIVRTAAGIDEDKAELARDLTYLLRLWASVQEAARNKRPPALVYREHDIVLRTIRDFFAPDIDEIHIDNDEVYQRARDFLQNVMPGKEHVVRCYRGEQPIFSAFDIESQIESVFKRRVQLRSGGSIVIDGTEALTAIDVNSGGSVRSANPEETAFRTNQEAATEVARQLRLRDIGGLIVVDFIDMRESRHIQEIERALRDAMHLDKARHEVGRISRLGLLEVSRQRMRPAAMATTYTACPMCEGHGAVRTTESAALVALRKIHNRVSLGDVASLRVSLPSAPALYLLNQKRDDLARLEQRYDTRLHVELNDSLMPHQVELDVRERTAVEKLPAVAPGSVAEADVPDAAENGNAATAAADGAPGKKKRRRRGRRRGSGVRAAAAIGAGLAALGGAPAPEEENVAERAPEPEAAESSSERASAGAEASAPRGGRSRGRRGGRRRRSAERRAAETLSVARAATPEQARAQPALTPAVEAVTSQSVEAVAPARPRPAATRPKRSRGGRTRGPRRPVKPSLGEQAPAAAPLESADPATGAPEVPAAAGKARPRARKRTAAPDAKPRRKRAPDPASPGASDAGAAPARSRKRASSARSQAPV